MSGRGVVWHNHEAMHLPPRRTLDTSLLGLLTGDGGGGRVAWAGRSGFRRGPLLSCADRRHRRDRQDRPTPPPRGWLQPVHEHTGSAGLLDHRSHHQGRPWSSSPEGRRRSALGRTRLNYGRSASEAIHPGWGSGLDLPGGQRQAEHHGMREAQRATRHLAIRPRADRRGEGSGRCRRAPPSRGRDQKV